MRRLTKREEANLVDTIILYISGAFFASFMLLMIVATFVAAYRGLM